MKCLVCNTRMICVNDYYSCGAEVDILCCPKCISGAKVKYSEGFIEKVEFNKYPEFRDFELKMLEEKRKEKMNREMERVEVEE